MPTVVALLVVAALLVLLVRHVRKSKIKDDPSLEPPYGDQPRDPRDDNNPRTR
jgi:hypothetical protein